MDVMGKRGAFAERIATAGWGGRGRRARSVPDVLRIALLITTDVAFGVLLAAAVSPLLGFAFFALVAAIGACAYREAVPPERRGRVVYEAARLGRRLVIDD